VISPPALRTSSHRTGVEYVLDGAMHNSTHDNTNLPFPFPDALQEFMPSPGGVSICTALNRPDT